MRDLREHGVDVVDDRPAPAAELEARGDDRWAHLDEFRWLREQGEALGFGSVFAGRLVRSSHRADEQRHAAATGRGRGAVACERGRAASSPSSYADEPVDVLVEPARGRAGVGAPDAVGEDSALKDVEAVGAVAVRVAWIGT